MSTTTARPTLAQIKLTVTVGSRWTVTNHYITREDHPSFGTREVTIVKVTGSSIQFSDQAWTMAWPRAAQVEMNADGTIRLYGGGASQRADDLFLTLVPVAEGAAQVSAPSPAVEPDATCPDVHPGRADVRCEREPGHSGACVADGLRDERHAWASRPARPLEPAAEASAPGICRHCGAVRPRAELSQDRDFGVCRDVEECFANADARHAARPQTEWTAAKRLHDVLSDILVERWLEGHDVADHVAALARYGALRPGCERDATAALARHLAARPRCDGPGYLADVLIDAGVVVDVARAAVVRHVAAGIVQALRVGATLEAAVRRPLASREVCAAAVAAGLSAAGGCGLDVWRCALTAAEVLVERATTGLPYVHLRAGRLTAQYPDHGARGRGTHVAVDDDGALWVLEPGASAWRPAR